MGHAALPPPTRPQHCGHVLRSLLAATAPQCWTGTRMGYERPAGGCSATSAYGAGVTAPAPYWRVPTQPQPTVASQPQLAEAESAL